MTSRLLSVKWIWDWKKREARAREMPDEVLVAARQRWCDLQDMVWAADACKGWPLLPGLEAEKAALEAQFPGLRKVSLPMYANGMSVKRIYAAGDRIEAALLTHAGEENASCGQPEGKVGPS